MEGELLEGVGGLVDGLLWGLGEGWGRGLGVEVLVRVRVGECGWLRLGHRGRSLGRVYNK